VATLKSISAVVLKDVHSEFRNRYGITALGLFVVSAVALVMFAVADETLQNPIAAAMLWVLMFYTALTGLGRGFVSEEERGTSLFLRLNAPSSSIYTGKLVINILLSTASNLSALTLFLVFLPVASTWNVLTLVTSVLVGSSGLASVITIVSAIVAKAGTRNALLPVLSFPMLVPIIMTGVNAMLMGFAGLSVGEAGGDLLFMLSYSGLVVLISFFVFDEIWHD